MYQHVACHQYSYLKLSKKLESTYIQVPTTVFVQVTATQSPIKYISKHVINQVSKHS